MKLSNTISCAKGRAEMGQVLQVAEVEAPPPIQTQEAPTRHLPLERHTLDSDVIDLGHCVAMVMNGATAQIAEAHYQQGEQVVVRCRGRYRAYHHSVVFLLNRALSSQLSLSVGRA